jgi:hypothetical protein
MSENNLTETWEVYTDAYNQTYITCKENNATAYFVNNGSVFYFTNYYGSKAALLYEFYLSGFRIVLSYMPQITVKDVYPLSVVKAPFFKWIQDFAAPFVQLIKPVYMLNYSSVDDQIFSTEMTLETSMEVDILGQKKIKRTSQLLIKNGALQQMIIIKNGKERIIKCIK